MQAKKRFGQNFLTDEIILNNLIKHIDISKNDKIIEIGPGKGDLTKFIIEHSKYYKGIEIDRDLYASLSERFIGKEIEFINKNILEISLSDLYQSTKIRLIGNIPYNISSPLINWCENNYKFLSDIHFMLQKEFALRCAGDENTNSYGKLSVICKYLFNVEILEEVSRESFYPQPKVESLFVRFIPKQEKINYDFLKNLKQVTTTLFNKKRKKISNSLKDILSSNEIDRLEIDLNLRPDELSLENFLQISNRIKIND